MAKKTVAKKAPKKTTPKKGIRGAETEKSHKRRVSIGFYENYLVGKGIDVGYRGDTPDAEPITEGTIGVDLDYPGYDGYTFPFKDEEFDFVYSSHCLEHLDKPGHFYLENMRVVKKGGFIIIAVPHKWLYEKKEAPPSRFNADHKRFYTPGSLLQEIEKYLPPTKYRVRHLMDCDEGHDYSQDPTEHSKGEYQIELVLQKL